MPDFLQKKENILYNIMKYILFDKIRIGEKEDSKKFYYEYFSQILKKTHSNFWEKKNSHFLTIINNPNLLRTYDYVLKSEQNFERFILNFERALLDFIYEKNKFVTIDDKKSFDEKNEEVEYLSDLEDEIIYGNLDLIKNDSIYTNKFSRRIKHGNIYNNQSNILSSNLVKDQMSNYNMYKKNFIPKYRKIETLKDKIPLLKNFNPPYTKRANIDKKILRKFKLFLKENYLEDICISNFWQKFIKENIFPPMKINDDKGGCIEFKSFNTKYLIWLFNQEGAYELYEEFLRIVGQDIFNSLVQDYEIENNAKEKENLEFYFFNLAEAFLEYESKTLGSEMNTIKEKSTITSISNINKIEVNKNGNSITSFQDNETSKNSIEDEAPTNPILFEDTFENYLGQNFDIKMNINKDIFNEMKNELYRCDNKKNKKEINMDKSFERSREFDYYLFDQLINSNHTSDKEE
jgi:hypothetical protein